MNEILKREVKNYWNLNPLFSYELKDLKNVPSRDVFDALDNIKLTDVERFSFHFWEFDQHAREKVLDIGCGPGFLVRNYARGKAHIVGLDMSEVSAAITKNSLSLYHLQGSVVVGDAENLPFKKKSFDFISSCGVLHHTPDTQRAITKLKVVLKEHKTAVISLYYKNILLKKWFFPWTLRLMHLFHMAPPGRSSMVQTITPEEFVRTYDGDGNPVGKAYASKDYRSLVKDFKILKEEVHFFPKRFLPFHRFIPKPIHYILDRCFGTVIHLKLEKID